MKMRAYIVEDNPTIRENLIDTLEEMAPIATVGVAETEEEGATWLASNDEHWDLAITDIFLKHGSGLGLLETFKSRKPTQKMVVFSNYATQEMRVRCAELGVDAVFDKSTEIENLLSYCTTQFDKLEPSAVACRNQGALNKH